MFKRRTLLSVEINTIHVALGSALLAIPIWYIHKYRRVIKRKVKEIDENINQKVIRRVQDPTLDGVSPIRMLELNPEFVEKHKGKWKLMSLGQYLSTLRPASSGLSESADQILQREMEVAVGQQLLQSLGPRIGAATLPMLGFTNIKSWTARMASSIASWFASHLFLKEAEEKDPNEDTGVLPFSLYELSAFANVYDKFTTPGKGTITAIEWLKRGEVGYNPSYAAVGPGDAAESATDGTVNKPSEVSPELVPNPFVVSVHWDKSIRQLEASLMEAESTSAPETPNGESVVFETSYDPNDRSFPEPKLINERLLPGLYSGWGDAKCTHTKREILRNRLLCVLLNRLSHNYYVKEQGGDEEDEFVIQIKKKTKPITRPKDFIKALLECGHSVEVCPRSTITTFGMAACVKNDDNTFTNIPLAYFLKTGYENEQSRPAHVVAPHGGMDLKISGPLVGKDKNGKDNKCNIQFYIAIEGMCGWHSNHNADVPWIEPVASAEPYKREMALKAIQLASLLAVVFNAIGTEMNLPFGGYGILGVCNDTAALMDHALRGETMMYPLVSTGRYLMHTTRRFGRLHQKLGQQDATNYREELEDIVRFMAATMAIKSDLHASPSNLLTASDRFLRGLPKCLPFQLEVESKEIMEMTKERFEYYDSRRVELETTWWTNFS